LLSLGKARLRENIRQRDIVLEGHAMCTSMLNIVVQEDVKEAVKTQGGL
jgi:hypothetical protein